MRDMTVGPAQGHLWRYALPILLGNWMQLAYNAVDSMIAGRFIGKEALAAEGDCRARDEFDDFGGQRALYRCGRFDERVFWRGEMGKAAAVVGDNAALWGVGQRRDCGSLRHAFAGFAARDGRAAGNF